MSLVGDLAAQKTKLFYIGDPLCSWCYAFTNELETFVDAHEDLAFELIVGGLRPNGTETNKELGDFLRKHWKEIEERTGMPFNYKILENDDLVYNTEPADRAVVVAKNMNQSLALAYFKAVQKAFYVDNKDILSAATYVAIAHELGLNSDEFKSHFTSDAFKFKTKQDFSTAQQMGIRGFPSLVLQHNNKLYLLSNGYRTAKELEVAFNKVMQSITLGN